MAVTAQQLRQMFQAGLDALRNVPDTTPVLFSHGMYHAGPAHRVRTLDVKVATAPQYGAVKLTVLRDTTETDDGYM